MSAQRVLRLDAYIRVSDTHGRAGPSFISPTTQRDRIYAWCVLSGAHVARVFEELDQSGRRSDRPLLQQALARIEAGRSDGLVVDRLDRFGRSLQDALAHLQRIQAAGGTFVSVSEGFDLSTDQGRLIMRIMLAYAEFESDRVRSNWDEARRRAVGRGLHLSALVPTGYVRGADKRLRPDRRTAPVIGEVFALRAAGASLEACARLLRDAGVRSGRGATRWTVPSLRSLLSNRVYLGEARCGHYRRPGAHPALVDAVTWRLAQYETKPRTTPSRPGLLYGLLRCASCRSPMTISADKGDRLYRCSRKPHQRGACPKKTYITATTVETFAEDLLFAAARRRPQLTRKTQSALLAAERRLTDAEADLGRYRDNPHLHHVLTDEQYADGLAVRNEAIRSAADRFVDARAARDELELLKLRGIQKRWPAMALADKRAALSTVFEALFLQPGHLHVEQRIWICERGEAPTNLPHPGLPQPPRPFTFPTTPYKVRRYERRLMAARRFAWTDADADKALRAFVADRTTMPEPAAFFRADQRRLYDYIRLNGGGPVWAARVGIRYPQGRRGECLLWTEDRIRDELDPFLKGRTIWPIGEQFHRAGKTQLWRALKRFGGIQRWAAEFDLPRSNFRGPHRRWTEEAIEQALIDLIGDRDQWPRRREFGQAGLDGCYAAMWRTGGVAVWAPRLGVHLPAGRGGSPGKARDEAPAD